MLSRPTRYGGAIAFRALLGCGDSTTAPPPECDGGVTATVSAGDIVPVVQYGVTPPGTIVQAAATALSPGVQHRVILLWWGPNRSLRMVANQNFWP